MKFLFHFAGGVTGRCSLKIVVPEFLKTLLKIGNNFGKILQKKELKSKESCFQPSHYEFIYKWTPQKFIKDFLLLYRDTYVKENLWMYASDFVTLQ